VVVVAAAVVPHCRPDRFGQLTPVAHNGLDAPRGVFGTLYGFVEVGDIGAVVLVVVDAHGLGVDVGLQGIEGIS
jgi:hypothetical protein